MDSNSTLGFAARFLFGLAGATLGLYVTSLGFGSAGSGPLSVPLLPGLDWLIGIGGIAFAVASILWALSPKRD